MICDPSLMYPVRDVIGCHASLKDGATPRQNIDYLLLRTDAKYWRKGIVEMLQGQSRGDNQKDLLSFLVSNVTNAIHAREIGPHMLVTMNYEDVPDNLDLVNWRRVLVGLNMVLEEPDTNRDIRSIGVSVDSQTDVTSLKGFLEVLGFLLQELPLDVVEFISRLSKSDASAIYETLSDTSSGFPIPKYCYGTVATLYERHMVAMRTLGFYRRSPEEQISWTKPERVSITAVICVIQGISKSLSGVQESCGK